MNEREVDHGPAPELASEPETGTLLRGLRILSCFDISHPEWTAIELSRATGLHKATAHRLIKTLESAGYLTFDQTTGKYLLGAKMLRAMYLLQSPTELKRLARPHLRKLSTTTGESVALSVWTDDGALLIDMVLTWRPFKPPANIGSTLTGLRNANSKLLVAFGPESRRIAVFSKPMERTSQYTITDPDELLRVLERVRHEGVAYDLQEDALGTCAIGAPVLNATGEIEATIAIVLPVERFGPAESKAYTEAVKATARDLSRDLGYRGSGPKHGCTG